MREKGLISFVMVLLLVAVLFSQALAQNVKEMTPIITPPDVQLTVTGRLIKLAAIGGETTGWAVNLDKPRQIGDRELKRLEIDPAGQKLGDFENKHLEITGTWQKRAGIERGEYWVLVVKTILVLSN